MLNGKNIVLGITGSIAAYKSMDLVMKLKRQGAFVKIILTRSGSKFVTPLSLEVVSGNIVYTDIFNQPLSHIALSKEAGIFIVAPATANFIGKYANGIADDLLTSTILAFDKQIIICPAMNSKMFENPIFQKNLKYLVSTGVIIVGPEKGELVCGQEGIGRMSDTNKIVDTIKKAFTKQDLNEQKILITAGASREYIDPVRFISNCSSGKMGFSLASVAKRRGADVTVISGKVSISPPSDITLINTETSLEMKQSIMNELGGKDIFIMCAAVSDFKPIEMKQNKILKSDSLKLDLIKTDDILKEVGSLNNKPFTIGFSAETGNKIDRAKKKLLDKNIDMIVFNDVSKDGLGFESDNNKVVLIYKNKSGLIEEKSLPIMSKEDVAQEIFNKTLEIKKSN